MIFHFNSAVIVLIISMFVNGTVVDVKTADHLFDPPFSMKNNEKEIQGIFNYIPLEESIQVDLFDACEEFDVDPAILLALVEHETKFNNVVSSNGKWFGYCQIDPYWWTGLMNDIGASDLMIPKDNFRTACAILSILNEKYGNMRDALSAYSSGHPGDTKYARDILNAADKWRYYE